MCEVEPTGHIHVYIVCLNESTHKQTHTQISNYVNKRIYIYIRIHTHMCICVLVSEHVRISLCVCVYIYIYTHINSSIYIYIYTHTHSGRHMYIYPYMSIYITVYTFKYMYVCVCSCTDPVGLQQLCVHGFSTASQIAEVAGGGSCRRRTGQEQGLDPLSNRLHISNGSNSRIAHSVVTLNNGRHRHLTAHQY